VCHRLLKISIVVLFVGCLALLGDQAFGESESAQVASMESLSMETLIEDAVSKNPQVLSSIQRWKAAKAAILSSWDLKNPQVSYDINVQSLVAFSLMFSASGIAFASHTDNHVHEQAIVPSEKTVVVEPQQVVVEIKGIVCSFCSWGVEKNLSGLGFVNKSRLGKNGVMVDINSGQTTIAVTPGEKIDFKAIDKAIKVGGYEPVKAHLNLSGPVTVKDNLYYLTQSDNGQVYELVGDETVHLKINQSAQIQGHFDASVISSWDESQPIKVHVDRIGSQS